MSAVLQPEGIQISKGEVDRRRKAMDADVWLFIKWICGHGADDLARFHRPRAYLLAGDAVRLAACLNQYESEVVTQIRADLTRRGIDWNTPDGIKRLKGQMRRVNERISRSTGKAQPLDANVLTPVGYRRMGDLCVGDPVIGRDGKKYEVTGVYPQGRMETFRVTLLDGSSTLATGDHLWATTTRSGHGGRRNLSTKTTTAIAKNLRYGKAKEYNHQIPYVAPVEFESGIDLPLDPYLMGVFLGDGSLTSGALTLSDACEDVVARFVAALPDGDVAVDASSEGRCPAVRVKRAVRAWTGWGRGVPSATISALRLLGLGDKRSFDKFVPECYKIASVEDRTELLRGLLDTDGGATFGGSIEYATKSPWLAEDVRFVVMSLGGRATITKRQTGYRKDGVYHDCGDGYRVVISFSNEIVPFSSAKNLARWVPLSRKAQRAISSVESVGEREVQCIAVSAPDQLYVTDDFIVTHNTIILDDVLCWLASVNPDEDVLLTSKSDDAAWAMCESIGNIMRTDAYKRYYADRFNPEWITKKWIRMGGRTKTNQDTIEARGINSQSYSKHYSIIAGDDLASTEAKQGDATVADALKFIASIHGISISERWGGTRYLFCGTIQGPKDDHAELSRNPEFITIVIPIWRHPTGAKWTVRNMMEDGIPVLPELYDAEACREKRADTLANESRGLGKISWLQNFLLCAHEAGAMQFTMELLRSQFFTRIYAKASIGGWLLRRYLYDVDTDGNRVPKRGQEFRTNTECRCYRACGLRDHAFVQFDPLTLPRNLGVDQAISGTGDDWGVGVAAVDPFGHKYQMKGAYDKGYWKMVAAIPVVFEVYGGALNPPDKIGIESNVWQQMSADWMKRDDTFQYLARRIEPLKPTQTAKIARIYNDIYAGLEDGTLWLDPDDEVFQRCALSYDASQPDKQWDDPLDAVAMAIQIHRHVASTMDDKELSRFAEEQAAALAGQSDAGSWIDNSTNLYLDTRWMN